MKIIEGHLTAKGRKVVTEMLRQNITECTSGKQHFSLIPEDDKIIVTITTKDRGLIPCPGSALRISKYKSTIKL